MTQGCPTFPVRDGNAFLREVRSAADTYFRERGRSSKATRGMMVKTGAVLALTFVPYALILTGWFPPLVMLALAGVVGLGMAGIGFAVGHDALHGAYSERPRVNQVIGWSMDLMGASSYLWKITHNVIHHTYTNIHGADEDLAVSPLLRLSPHSERRWYHRFQHLYALPLYGLTTLFWVFVKDYKYLLKRELGPYPGRQHSLKNLAGVAIGKVVYYGWSLVLPFVLLELPWWQIALGILTAHLIAGFALGIVFQLAHVVEETTHPLPDDAGAMPQSWVVHEMYTTANFAPSNRLLGWYVGGLNYQVEHHLLPKVCSVHYPELSVIVRRIAREHNLPYHSHVTLTAAVRSHARTLRFFGQPFPSPSRVVAPALQ